MNLPPACTLFLLLSAALPAAAQPATAARVNQPAAHTSPVWVDVRSPQEFAAGSLSGAHNIPHDQIARLIAARVPDKNTPLMLYCRSGRRAEHAKQILENMGYRNVRNRGSYEALHRSGTP